MKPTLRKHVAAALMLLAPLGAALVAQPAAAEHQREHRAAPAAMGTPVVDSFVTDLAGRLEPGRVLHFRLLGTPGARATINIPETVRDLPMREVQPGVYVGDYTIRRSDNVDLLDRAVAVLRTSERHVAAWVNMAAREDRLASRQGHDRTPPRILDLTPGNGDRLSDNRRSTRLSARLSDDGSGVDPDSVRLRLNGRDVTHDTRVSADEIRYREDLPRGRYSAELTVRDRAGNASRAAWTFDVV